MFASYKADEERSILFLVASSSGMHRLVNFLLSNFEAKNFFTSCSVVRVGRDSL